MTITLTPEQLAWIDERVARGDYASPDEAAQSLIAAAILDVAMSEADDLAWAKPLVDAALADVEAGRVLTAEEHLARIDAHIAAMKR